MNGQIIKIISDDNFVEIGKEVVICKARGKFRNDGIAPKVGDYVVVNKEEKVIEKILPRENELDRPNVSNIDEAFIITSLKHPDFSSNLLDKLISVCEINSIKPVICFTKRDLLSKEEFKELKKIVHYYRSIGYICLYNTNLWRIKRRFKNKTIVFTGQTGAGKSTLLNKLDKSLNFETNEISMALGRGKHTTRYVTLVSINGGKVLDTPGFSSIDLKDYSDEQIKSSFVEFNKYYCPYKNCMHINEKECEVKKHLNTEILISRYENYIKFIEKR